MPSTKYCCSGSSLRFANGSTIIDSRGTGRVSPDHGECQRTTAMATETKHRAPTTAAMMWPRRPWCARNIAPGMLPIRARVTGSCDFAFSTIERSLPLAGKWVPFRSARGLNPCDRGDKAVTTSGHGLDAAARFSVLVENAAQCGNLDGQVAFFDHHSGPDGFHNCIFRDQLPLPLYQKAEQIQCTRADRDRGRRPRVIEAEQPATRQIEPKALEEKDFGCTGPVHALVSPVVIALAQGFAV